MDGSYRYNSGRSITRRRTPPKNDRDAKQQVITVKLVICAAIFVIAVLMKVVFPDYFDILNEKLTTAVDYKTALTVLGEGLSGERKFTTAIGEAFTYAFTGSYGELRELSENKEQDENTVETFGENVHEHMGVPEHTVSDDVPTETIDITQNTDTIIDVSSGTAAISAEPEGLAEAIISAFLESQEAYSDYNLPAGTTYEMPSIGISCALPAAGKITSPFGFRVHPTDGSVKFHYGVDIQADEGTPITAFADGEVIAVGESTTMGEYIILRHSGVETKYAHCSEILVTGGQVVKIGDVIAKAGSTGNATSTCLHFELIIDGIWVNPEYYF